MPEVGSDETSSALALATPSIPPRRAVCACPTRVTTPIVGEATSHKCVISPNPRIPISTTTVRAPLGVLMSVKGTPCSLLKLFGLAHTAVELRAPAMRFFVEVLPTLPVTPTTATSDNCCERTCVARSENACIVSSTTMSEPATS